MTLIGSDRVVIIVGASTHGATRASGCDEIALPGAAASAFWWEGAVGSGTNIPYCLAFIALPSVRHAVCCFGDEDTCCGGGGEGEEGGEEDGKAGEKHDCLKLSGLVILVEV